MWMWGRRCRADQADCRARPGDKVSKGDLLLEIDPAIQQARCRRTGPAWPACAPSWPSRKAELDFARQQAERQNALQADGATKAEDVQSAQSQLRVTQARIASLKAQIDGAQSTLQGNEALLGYTRIYATMDGTVVTLDAREGRDAERHLPDAQPAAHRRSVADDGVDRSLGGRRGPYPPRDASLFHDAGLAG